MQCIIIYGGSSGASGKTREIVQSLNKLLNAKLVNLSEHSIGFFDYSHQNKDDEFKDIAQQMVSADCIIFATPVYWYAMSAQLKVFFDRLSDLITVRKSWGRQLKGKSMAFVATGHDSDIPDGFTVPFQKTAEYFDMQFKGGLYVCTNAQMMSNPTSDKMLQQFAASLSRTLNV